MDGGRPTHRVIGMSEKAGRRKRDCTLDAKASRVYKRLTNRPPTRNVVRRELSMMNRHKRGRPFEHPDCVIAWVMTLRATGRNSYRDVVGDAEDRLLALGLPPLSHSQLYHRAQELAERAMRTTCPTDGRVLGMGWFQPSEGRRRVIVDSSGFSLNKYGGWIFHKWNLEPVTGWVKLHAAVDAEDMRVLAYVISDEGMGDISAFPLLMGLLEQGGHDVAAVFADGAYDKIEHWQDLRSKGIEFIVNISSPLLGKYRRGGVPARGSPQRAAHIRRINEIGLAAWKREVGYNVRWTVERVFSDLKRRFGDTMRARDRYRMAGDLYWRMFAYNGYKEVRAGLASARPAVMNYRTHSITKSISIASIPKFRVVR